MASVSRNVKIHKAYQQFRGVFPYNKEKGTHYLDVVDWLYLTFNEEFEVGLKKYGMKVGCSTPLDRTASGVMMFSLGNLDKYMKYTQFSEMVYTVEGKLGASTSTFESTGEVTGERSSGHVTRDLLSSTCRSFEGTVKQIFPLPLSRQQLIITENFSGVVTPQIIYRPRESEQIKIYNEGRPEQDVVCKRIDVLDYNPPYFKLKIVSEGRFSCRTFVNDMGLKMDTLAHLTDCRRERLGLLSAEDGIEKHELYWPEVKKACNKYTSKFVDSCKPFLDRLPLYKERRLR